MPYTVTTLRRRIQHTRIKHSDKICFNLKIDIISMWIILPMTRFRRHYPVENIVAGCLVRMPKLVISICKLLRIEFDRSIKSVFSHHLKKCQVHINIIIQTRILNESIVDIVVVPYYRLVILNQTALEFKFCRTTVCTAYGLSKPPATNFVG